MKTVKKIQISVTFAMCVIALVHIIFPKLNIDSITLTLLIVAVIPWLFPLFKSLELPGGFKFEFQELELIEKRIKKVGLINDRLFNEDGEKYTFVEIANENPQLALAGLRIELEKRLRELRNLNARDGIVFSTRGSIRRMMQDLYSSKIVTEQEKNILIDLVGSLNKAVHGENVDYRVAQWVIDIGPKVLDAIDKKIELAKDK